MLQKQTYVVRHKTTLRALICSYGRHFCECPRELTLGRETKTEISCEWNTKFSIIPEIPLKSERVHSKRIPKFSKTFTGIFTVPFSFGPEISEILVEWKAPTDLPNKFFYSSNETTRSARKTWAHQNPGQKLVCTTIMCNKWRWLVSRIAVAQFQPSDMMNG